MDGYQMEPGDLHYLIALFLLFFSLNWNCCLQRNKNNFKKSWQQKIGLEMLIIIFGLTISLKKIIHLCFKAVMKSVAVFRDKPEAGSSDQDQISLLWQISLYTKMHCYLFSVFIVVEFVEQLALYKGVWMVLIKCW